MSEPMKNAVVVGKVTLAPKREVVIAKKPVQNAPAPRQERPRRQDRPQDPKTVNTAQMAELQFLKKQINGLKAQAELDKRVRTALVALMQEIETGPALETLNGLKSSYCAARDALAAKVE